MKHLLLFTVCASTGFFSSSLRAQTGTTETKEGLYLDVHHLGKVSAKSVEAVHAKDLAVEKKHGVRFLKYWIDQEKGDVYCLASGPSAEALRKTHAEAHGLLPDNIYEVVGGQELALKGANNLYLDIHEVGAGVKAEDVAKAHEKDLAVEKKYGVNLVDYWFDSSRGRIMCLAQAPDATALIQTHKEAHGMVPLRVFKVKQGQ
jgi:hypothetical protein